MFSIVCLGFMISVQYYVFIFIALPDQCSVLCVQPATVSVAQQAVPVSWGCSLTDRELTGKSSVDSHISYPGQQFKNIVTT